MAEHAANLPTRYLRTQEAARILGLSERTIENHLRRIRKRLGVATTAQAVRVAIRNGDIAV